MKISKGLIPFILKNGSDLIGSLLAVVGKSSAIVAFLFYAKQLLKSKMFFAYSIVSLMFFLIEPFSFRVYVSIGLIELGRRLINSNDEVFNKQWYIFLVIISLAILAGTFVSGFYDEYWYGRKYKFIYNDANNFGPYVAFYLSLALFFSIKKTKPIVPLALAAVLLYSLVLTLGRMYISIGVMLVLAYLFIRNKKIFSIVLAAVIIFVIGFVIFYIDVFETLSARLFTSDGSIHLSGRDTLWGIFYEYREGLSFFEYFIPTKSKFDALSLMYLPPEGHSVVENSYYASFIGSGVIGFLMFIICQLRLVIALVRKRLFITSFFCLYYYLIWFFDDSAIYPISILHQVFTIVALGLIEDKIKKDRITNEGVRQAIQV
jgi:O-antigen ligase